MSAEGRSRRRTTRGIAAAVGAGALLALLALWLVARPVRVTGGSMEPTLRAGDLVLVLRPALARRLVRPGQVVLAVPPGERSVVVKRVRAVERREGGALWLELTGDAAGRSRDSRRYGPVPARALRGLVLVRLAPRPGPIAQRDGSRAARPAGR